MTAKFPLADAFLATRADAWRHVAGEDLEAGLREMIGKIREGGLDWDVADEGFVEFVAGRVAEEVDPVVAIRVMHASDLYLSYACSLGLTRAIRLFEQRYANDIDRTLAHLRLTADLNEEASQLLRYRLFSAGGRGPGGIATYAGRAALRSWVRSATVHAALDCVREVRRLQELDREVVGNIMASSADLELEYLASQFGEHVHTALREAFASLAPRDRNLLRWHFAQGVTLDELSRRYRVHRATIARWIAAARQTATHVAKDWLIQHAQVTESEAGSLLRAIRSQIDVSLKEDS